MWRRPAEGTATVNSSTGEITFTPTDPVFTGIVSYEYTVCETVLTSNCATATQIITVVGANVDVVSASDDYNRTVQGQSINASIAEGLLANDKSTDAAATLQVSASSFGTFDIAGKGLLSIGANGGYIFTPDPGFTGPVSYHYEVCDAVACASATLYLIVDPFETNPDINSTFVGVQVDGNVNTNDVVVAGTTYGTPTADAGNPTTEVPTMAADGTYTFTPLDSGVYRFEVPVCLENQALVDCAVETLTITVRNGGNVTDVPPIANTDIAITPKNTAVTINSLANDAAKSKGASLDLASVAIIAGTEPSPSTEGTLTIDAAGNITFTPVPSFFGTVTYSYKVCDDQTPALCAQAIQEVTVLNDNAQNTISATDDYLEITVGAATATGNVLTNDIDPEGNPLVVTAETVADPNAGSVVFNTDGTYTFTPTPNYTGPGEFAYTVCDNIVPAACTQATLHVLVNPEVFTVSGTTWYDPDGLSNDAFDGTAQGSADATNAGTEPLFVNYIYNGNVVASVPVETDGTWSLEAAGYPNAIVQLSINQGLIGQAKPATELPAGWGFTGEGVETGPSPVATGDGAPDGEFYCNAHCRSTCFKFWF